MSAPEPSGTGTDPQEQVPGIVTTDPGPQQQPGQGEQAPEEVGTLPPEDPDGEPGFA